MIIDFYTNNLKNQIIEETARAISAETALKTDTFSSVEYDASGKTIDFYNGFNNKIGSIDASSFVIDGMIEDVYLSGTILTIVFNTDAGKQNIEVDLSDIFNPDLYWTSAETKNAIDEATSGLQETLISGQNIKTINNQSILGAGNLDIGGGSGSYSAGTNIDITDNVISVTGITVPTKTSDLLNDSGFVDSGDVETQITEKNYITSAYCENFVTSAQVETQIEGKHYITSADTQNFVTSGQVETQITGKGYATSGDVNTAINNLSGAVDTVIADVELVTSQAYNELHSGITELSASCVNFVSSAQVETQIEGKHYITSADTQNFVTSAQVETQITSKGYLTSADTQNFITSGALVTVEEVVSTAINDLESNKVGSNDIDTIVKISQTDYDNLQVKDSRTLYVIVNN